MQSKRKVLIIDDEGDLVEMLLLRLEMNGFLVDVALDGQVGVAKARSFQPDLILLDIVMPVMDGWEVCRQLRADPKTKDLRIVVMTAGQRPDLQEKADQYGVDRVLIKPYSEKDLIALLADVSSSK